MTNLVRDVTDRGALERNLALFAESGFVPAAERQPPAGFVPPARPATPEP